MFGLVISAAVLWKVLPNPPVSEENAVIPPRPRYELKRVGIVLRNKGSKQVQVRAEVVEVSSDLQLARFKGITEAILFEQGRPALRIKGDEILFNRRTRELLLRGPVEVTSAQGEHLAAPEARWVQTAQRLILPAGVRLELNGGEVRAAELVADAGMKTLRFSGGVQVALTRLSGSSPKGKTTGNATRAAGAEASSAVHGRLRAETVRYDARRKLYTAEGSVSLAVDDTTIRAARIQLALESQIAEAAGDVIVTRLDTTLKAPSVRYEIQKKVARASGGAILLQGGTSLQADQMQFDLESQVTSAEGGVRLKQRDLTLTATWLKYDATRKELFAGGGVRLEREGSVLVAQDLIANLDSRQAEAGGGVKLVVPPRKWEGTMEDASSPVTSEETVIQARRMVFRWDPDGARAEGGVVIKQRASTAKAERASYEGEAGEIVLEGQVVVEQQVGQVKGGSPGSPKDAEAGGSTDSTATLTCERLVLLLKGGDMRAEGKVTVSQRGRVARGDLATYTGRDRKIVLTGNAQIRTDDGGWLRADRVTFLLSEEVFEASGGVETEFTIKREGR